MLDFEVVLGSIETLEMDLEVLMVKNLNHKLDMKIVLRMSAVMINV